MPKLAKTRKTTTVHHFWKVVQGLGDALGGYVGAMLGHVGAILEQLGDKVGPESAKISQENA